MIGFDDEPYGAVMYEKKKSQKLHQTARMDLPLIEIEENVGKNGLRGIFEHSFGQAELRSQLGLQVEPRR